MSLASGGIIKNGSVTEIVSGGVFDHAAVAAACSSKSFSWLLLLSAPAINHQSRSANVVRERRTTVITDDREFVNVSPAAEDKVVSRIQMLKHNFSFFEHFLQVIDSRQVNLDAFVLDPK